jgi:cholesterol transport system auxiliary component
MTRFPTTRLPLAMLPLLALGACVNIGGGKAPAQLYTLTATSRAPAGPLITAKAGDALVVSDPETDRSLALLRMAVQVTPTSIAYLKDANWVERPARLLRNLLAEDLRAGGKRLVLLDDDSEGPRGLHLGGRLLAMGYDAHAHAAVIRYDAVLSDGKGGVIMRRFEASEPDVSPNGAELAQALNTAANTIAGQVGTWIDATGGTITPAPTPVPSPQSAPQP